MVNPETSLQETRTLIVWRFTDGKAGHENQTAGLIQALQSLHPIDVHELTPPPPLLALGTSLLWWFPWGDILPDPDLIIGAGHRTHLAMLAARRARGGRTVVLMRPSLPMCWFDLCLIPAHDHPPEIANVVATQGVLNRIRPGLAKDPQQGLILIGGPSRHHGWSNEQVIEQVRGILAATPTRHWLLTTSRRTPADFIHNLRDRVIGDRLEIIPYEATSPDWLPKQLAWASQVWVTADSVSMLYESLTAGAAVGVLEVPILQRDRVVIGVESLIERQLITRYEDWRATGGLEPPAEVFDEATRCAREILARWF